MKRILLSLGVAALVSVAGASLAQDYDNTAPTSPNNPSTPNNTAPSMTTPGTPAATSGTVVRVENWPTNDPALSLINVKVNGQQTTVTPTAPGNLTIQPGTPVRDLKVEISAMMTGSSNGSKMERCAQTEVVGGNGEKKADGATETLSQISLKISKKGDGKYVCDKASLILGAPGGFGTGGFGM